MLGLKLWQRDREMIAGVKAMHMVKRNRWICGISLFASRIYIQQVFEVTA